MLIYGKNSVFERLKVNPKSIKKILMSQDFKFPNLEKLIKINQIPTQRLSKINLSKIKPSTNLQGIVAYVEEFCYTPFEKILIKAKEKGSVILFLDRITDPQNLGAIIRICACFGNFSIVIPEYKACPITETVLNVAKGGENYVEVAKVVNLCNSILEAKRQGFWIAGAIANKNEENISKISFPFPLGIVLGSEGEGIRYGIDKHLDIKFHIYTSGADLSLNVTSACSIICYEISRQWKKY
ncbi:MAG: RNA methyltransferase [Candidatus Omnitrophica bacterium]|nr:RNA methyltransferase [Candidatus Omnitrophota bacterium]